ncbi:flagellar basal body rod protein FlgC [Paragemmobacter ruber]|uniref:Flagellar basal body rod protein FlgC n=1 Tax=Paragemmobacter ruber TaxID=1985673 RepID=A0ABW9Y4E0_9RHOB|nr:flagellar basal body rod protein FlgC [Rhodobacter ruber]NBE07386.1 flagellar basal body rod protein FlgC [Rhodobacter ruber]
MNSLTTALAAASSGMDAQAMRLRHVSENIANADTPGYQRKIATFQIADGGVRLGPLRLDDRPGQRVHDPAHPLADQTGHYDGSNVDLIMELADAREAQRGYEANLRIFDQARQMMQSLFDLIRR